MTWPKVFYDTTVCGFQLARLAINFSIGGPERVIKHDFHALPHSDFARDLFNYVPINFWPVLGYYETLHVLGGSQKSDPLPKQKSGIRS